MAASPAMATPRKRLRPLETNLEKETADQLEPEDEITALKNKRRCLAEGRNRGPAPFTRDFPLPRRRRQVPLTYEEAVRGTTEPVRVYADGIFDLFHVGHSHCLLQAKKVFPNTHLIVGIQSQRLTTRYKGTTVCNEVERYDAVRHCRYVDEVLTGAPWIVTPEFMDKYQIDFIAHDDNPYPCGDVEDIYRPIREMGRFVTIKRNTGVSTSGLIARIVRDYDVYLSRNLERGYTAQELNVGLLKAKQVQFAQTRKSFYRRLLNLLGKISGLFRSRKQNNFASPSGSVDEVLLRECDAESSAGYLEQNNTEETTMARIQALYDQC